MYENIALQLRRALSLTKVGAAVIIFSTLAACGSPDSADNDRQALNSSSSASSNTSTNSTNGKKASTRASASATPQKGAPQRRAAQPNIRRIDARTVIADVSNSLMSAHGETETALRKAGLGIVVDDIKRLDGQQLHDIEARSLVKEVYRRAEAHTPGQGDRVLAHLYKTAASTFPAVAEDPAFRPLRESAASLSAESLDPTSFRFASASDASKIKIPPHIDVAIKELSYVYSKGNIPEFTQIMQRAFPKANIPDLVARNSDVKGVMRDAFNNATPPPTLEARARVMIAETGRFPAATESANFARALAKIDAAETGFRGSEDALHKKLAAEQDALASRQAQSAQAKSIGAPGSVEISGKSAVKSLLHPDAVPPAQQRVSGVALQKSAQLYANYLATSFDGYRAAGGGGTASGGGNGSLKAKGNRSYSTTRPSLATRPGGVSAAPRVSPTYGRAIRSARAARGIAAGAEITPPNGVQLTNIGWIPNPDDDRFGRIVIEAISAGDRSILYMSRTLFTDSFDAASDILWGGHYGPMGFKEGNIFVVMSMDPFSQPDPNAAREIEDKVNKLRLRALMIGEDDLIAQGDMMSEIQDVQKLAGKLPRAIVFHPALYGRELAWTTARVDFWFNDREGLSQEASAMNGGISMPEPYHDIEISKADTWQFYERPATIRLSQNDNGLGRVSVVSSGSSERSRFGVSMFVFSDAFGEYPDGKRLPKLENELQPMLDWLALNHHDFIRLNDFSEAFALLRWANKNGAAPIVLDANGEAPLIATPDRVVIGDGPKVK